MTVSNAVQNSTDIVSLYHGVLGGGVDSSVLIKTSVVRGEAVGQIVKNVEEVKKSVEQLKRVATTMGTKLEFSVDSKLGAIVVSVIDPSTGQVLRQIPPEAIRRVHSCLQDTIGLLYDEFV